jgi:4-oxalocrotonate tautomerase
MPVLHFHLVEDQYSQAQCETLMTDSSKLYAEVLDCPIERVRVFINLYRPTMVAVAGITVAKGGTAAPYFEFLALAGRPLEQRQRLLTGFTDLLERILGVEKSLIRGGCWTIPAEDWCIGGAVANDLRAQEISARLDAPD